MNKDLKKKFDEENLKILNIRKDLCRNYVRRLNETNKREQLAIREVYDRYPCDYSDHYTALSKELRELRNSILNAETRKRMRDIRQEMKAMADLNQTKRDNAETEIRLDAMAQRLFLKECFRANCDMLIDDERKLKSYIEEEMRTTESRCNSSDFIN